MNLKPDKESYDYVLNLHNLIVPKLEAFKNTGDSSIIHDCNEWLNTLFGWKHIYEKDHKLTSLSIWREYIISAENYLASHVK